MARSITNLPDELLINIISYLDLPSEYGSKQGWSKGDVRPTLCALAVTCRRLSAVARECMLRDVKLATGWTSSFGPVYTTKRLRNFSRMCYENPESINYIKSLEMQADFSATPDWGSSDDDKAPDILLQRVSRSSSLSRIRLLLPGPGALSWLESLLPFNHGPSFFPHLHYLELDCGSGPIAPLLLLDLCSLPSLKHFKITSPLKQASSGPSLDNMTLLKTPCRWRLHGLAVEVINATDVHAPSIHACKMLERMPKLQELHLSVPGPGVFFADPDESHLRFRWGGMDGSLEFSPAQHKLWLNPVADTLRSLSMFNPQVFIQAHDGSLLDLSNFRQLEHLKISIHFLCQLGLSDARKIAQPDIEPRVPTKSTCELFPRSLQTLEIHYDSDQGIFYDRHHLYLAHHAGHKDQLTHLVTRDIPADKILPMMYNELWTDRINSIEGDNGVLRRLAWLFKLRDVRRKEVPKLTTLTVHETYARTWLWKDFNLAALHPGVFFDQVLKVNVVLRVPKMWDPPVLNVV